MVERGDIHGKSSNRFLVILLFLILLFIVVLGAYIIIELENLKTSESVKTCGDGTFYETCSLTKPFFCNEGVLLESSTICGCPKGFVKKDNLCISDIQREPKEVSFKYILRGEEGSIDFIMYEGIYEYLYTIPRTITYAENEISSRADFKLKSIDEEIQRNFLLPLVIEIQNSASTKEDQARIAISLVQNIPFGNSDSSIKFGGNSVGYSRYPYQVLYDNEGVCGEKVELLGFLLRELGYGVSFFYFSEENHEALGIKCPGKESLIDTGYCFIETTGPSIITQDELYYYGFGKIDSTPQIFLLADGFALGDNLYEYKDADRMDRIKKSVENRNGRLDFFKYLMNKKLKTKYGLDGFLQI
jgi:hypothetical protein